MPGVAATPRKELSDKLTDILNLRSPVASSRKPKARDKDFTGQFSIVVPRLKGTAQETVPATPAVANNSVRTPRNVDMTQAPRQKLLKSMDANTSAEDPDVKEVSSVPTTERSQQTLGLHTFPESVNAREEESLHRLECSKGGHDAGITRAAKPEDTTEDADAQLLVLSAADHRLACQTAICKRRENGNSQRDRYGEWFTGDEAELNKQLVDYNSRSGPQQTSNDCNLAEPFLPCEGTTTRLNKNGEAVAEDVAAMTAELARLADGLLPNEGVTETTRKKREEEYLSLRERLHESWEGKSYYERLAELTRGEQGPVSSEGIVASTSDNGQQVADMRQTAETAEADVSGRPVGQRPGGRPKRPAEPSGKGSKTQRPPRAAPPRKARDGSFSCDHEKSSQNLSRPASEPEPSTAARHVVEELSYPATELERAASAPSASGRPGSSSSVAQAARKALARSTTKADSIATLQKQSAGQPQQVGNVEAAATERERLPKAAAGTAAREGSAHQPQQAAPEASSARGAEQAPAARVTRARTASPAGPAPPSGTGGGDAGGGVRSAGKRGDARPQRGQQGVVAATPGRTGRRGRKKTAGGDDGALLSPEILGVSEPKAAGSKKLKSVDQCSPQSQHEPWAKGDDSIVDLCGGTSKALCHEGLDTSGNVECSGTADQMALMQDRVRMLEAQVAALQHKCTRAEAAVETEATMRRNAEQRVELLEQSAELLQWAAHAAGLASNLIPALSDFCSIAANLQQLPADMAD